MAKLTVADLTLPDAFDDSYYGGWGSLSVRGRPGNYLVVVNSVLWRDEDAGRSSYVDSDSGFESVEAALQWGVDRLNDVPARLACIALEQAFHAMEDWLPQIAPLLKASYADGASAAREACAVELDVRAAWLDQRELAGGSELRGAAASIRARDVASTTTVD